MTSIAALARDPSPLTHQVTVGGTPMVIRALTPADEPGLTAFLAGLSDTSRRFWHNHTDDAAEAAGWIDAIGRYDKLRLVTEPLAGVVDLSFSLPEGFEITRYAGYGTLLRPERTVRFGICVADAWHGRGLADALVVSAWQAAGLLGRDTAVLVGGVNAANARARAFYRRQGFTDAGVFGDSVDMIKHPLAE